ncbi:aminoglycoside phosphotransferase family protein [Euzebya tangerina]|uniref:aminoglycoside phosphotransferase family protein n=1 Tax=Euzebya tangerina TaxID=591198 RepID=UPI00196A933F|nr:aminoglycoside phosphotransferase family protein [Euzebya tangerina]
MMHTDELNVSAATVRALLRDQFSELAHLPLRRYESSGTVNAIFRLGESLAAKFPLRKGKPEEVASVIAKEKAAAVRIAGLSPVPVPSFVGMGRPGAGYPLAWSVQTWLPGEVATSTSLGDSETFAMDLAGLIGALRYGDTRGEAFAGSNRGGSLPVHDEWVDECLQRSRGLLDTELLRALWQDFRRLPQPPTDVLSHTDLIPANLLTDGTHLTGVLDVGGFGPADPALDLVAGWHLLDVGPRQIFRELLGSDDVEWQRGKAWAFEQALGAVWYYLGSNHVMTEMGSWTLHRIVEDETGDGNLLAHSGSTIWKMLATS